ncbi:MAG: CPBP family glutamic-type intramembrane protease [Pseudomonadota bacterium]
MQLGILFYLAKKRGNRGWSLEGIVVYNAKLHWTRYFLWVLAILIPTALTFTALQPVTDEFRAMFGFMDLIPATDPEKTFPQWLVIITLISGLIFTAFLVPITEELYFRGYLLPECPKNLAQQAQLCIVFCSRYTTLTVPG